MDSKGSSIVETLSTKFKRYPKWVSFIVLFLVVVVTPVTILLLDNFVKPAESWFNTSWEFRKEVTVTNGGTSKTNYDLLVTLDTAALVAAGKIQSDCDDIRFVDSDDTTTLSYWIEAGCNTTTTQVWVRIPSVPVGSKTIYFYYGNGAAVSAQQAWSGNFIVLNNVACGAGWTRATSFDGKFIRGANGYGTTGGTDVHNHGQVSGTSGGSSSTSTTNGACDLTMSSPGGHTGTKADVSNASTLPPYLDMVFCQSPSLTVNTGNIVWFDATVPTGWTRFTALDSKFPRGSATYGGTGGSTTHTHPFTGGYATGGSAEQCAAGADGGGSAAWAHGHTSLGGTTGSGTNTPPYLNMIYGSINASGVVPVNGIVASTVVPPLGWTRFSALDSNYPRGASTYGSTGGATTHTHSITITLDTYSGGRFPRNTVPAGTLAGYTHNHTLTTTTASASNLPSYLNSYFIKKNNNAGDSISFSLSNEQSNAPAAPTSVAAQALTTSSIRWNFVDNATNETGFKVVDELGVVKATCASADLTYCDETGLSANTQYTRAIIAYNANGDSQASSLTSRYTLINTPTISTTTVATTSIGLNAAGVSNLGVGLSALYFDCTSASCDSGLNVWNPATTATATSLTNNTQYTFVVKARNGDGVETLDSDSVSKYTLALFPTVSIVNPTSTSFTVSVTNVPNLGADQGAIHVICTTGCSIGDIWTASDQVVLSGMSPNIQYSFTVKVRNGEGVETSSTDPVSGYTLANAPLDPVASEITEHTFRVSLNQNLNSNPSSVLYSVKYGANEFISNVDGSIGLSEVWADYDTWTQGGGVLVSGLTEGSQHILAVRAKNSEDVTTAYSGSTEIYTLLSTPILVSGQALSSSSIRWNFTDGGVNESGFKVYDSSGSLLITCATPDITFCDETGLSPNTTYTRKVKAYNANVDSVFSGTQSETTRAAIPSLTNLSGTQGRVSFGVTMNGNPGGTEISIFEEGTGKYYSQTTGELISTPTWFEYVDTGVDFDVNNLDPNTEYIFKVKARNSEAVETAYSGTYSVYTHAVVPSVVSAEGVSSTGVNVTLGTGGNPSTTTYAVREVNSGKFIDEATNTLSDTAVWSTYAQYGGASGVTVNGLLANTQYTFDVKARNANDIETAFSTSVSGYTYANAPTVVSLSPSSSTVLVIVVGSSSNPVYTQFAVRENTSGLYVNNSTGVLQASPSWATYAQWGSVTGFGVVGLSPNSEYTFSTIAKNNDDINTSFSVGLAKYTLANVPGSVEVSDISVSSLKAVLDLNGNPISTQLALYNSTKSKYVDYNTGNDSDTPVWGTYAQWGGDNGYTISGLESGTTYEFVAKARNADNIETSFSVGSNVSTSLNAPTIGTPIRLSETSIRWVFTDNETNEQGYRVYDTNGVQVAECLGTALTSCIEYGMTPNTLYTRKVAAYNATGRGDYSSTASKYTPAATPQFSSSEASSSTAIKLVVNASGNPSNTQYQVREVISGLKVGDFRSGRGRLLSADSWYTLDELGGASGFFVSELFANAEYQFAVVARDGEDVITSTSDIVTIYTLSVQTSSPALTPLSESRIKVVIDNGGNPEVTTFAFKDVTTSKYFNYTNGLWETDAVWGTYTNWGRGTGFSISGLGINTEYEFHTISRNGQNVESTPSPSSKIYTLSNTPGRVGVTLNTPTSLLIKVSANQNPANTDYSIMDIVSGKSVDPRTGTLVSDVKWGKFADFGGLNGMTINGLVPGARHEFIAKSRNGNLLESGTSSSFVSYTLASIPGVESINTVTLRSLTLRIFRNANDSSVQYSIYEESQGRFVDFRTGLLTTEPVWGTYSEFGGNIGVLLSGLAPVSDYSFRINARNGAGIVTGLGARTQYGTNAIIENIPVGVLLRLKSSLNVDPSTDLGGQRGVQEVRVLRNNTIVADVPIEFTQNRDWSSAVIVAEGSKVVVKLPETAGLKGTYTMYVPKEESNRFKLCTKAESIDEVNSDCAGSVVFAGPYPQTIDIDGSLVTVSTSVIDGVSYWVVSGLTGTGGLGETVDTGGEVKEPTVEDPEKEEEEPITPPVVINTPIKVVNDVVNTVLTTVAETNATEAIDGVKIAIDNSVVGDLPEPQLTAVTTTATAATVTVGLAAIGGGFSSVPYFLTQLFLSMLSLLGFRKKGKPYGYVYDSVTKEPVSRAIVRIYDVNDKLVWTDVTDVYGSFNVELPKGKYKLLVKKGGFKYPTEIVKGVVDYPLEPIYKGELFSLSKREEVRVLIPIDPTKVDRFKALSVSARTSINLILKMLHAVIFVGGIILGVYTVVKFPSLTNWIVIAFYIPAFYMLYKSMFGEEASYGIVTDIKGKPIENVEIAIKEMKFDRFVSKRITDKNGKYRFVIYPGAYELVVISSDYKAMKFEGGSSVVNITAKGEKTITKNIVVRKK
ncbi:DUF2341 domain-containing protein [Candidatus Dojkabacteria bacterium]|nr:DUF2341 domain-containing protein [Candidatus Dojkabacteria bacterium]